MERNAQIENIAAMVLIAFLAAECLYIVRPFLPAVLWAIIFAVSSWPLFSRLEKRLGGRLGAAAGAVTLPPRWIGFPAKIPIRMHFFRLSLFFCLCRASQ